MAKKLTSSKAKEILHDKSVHGHPLTDKQRKFFGAIAGGANPYEQGGLVLKKKTKDNYDLKANPNDVKASVGPGFVGAGYDITGRNYSPAWGGQFAMGGGIPGAVGFTYARTVGAAPSNGKYAKKTKASAQNGKEMSFYQQGLDFTPKSISKNGKKVIKDSKGQWAHPGDITEIPSNEITMRGVPYPVLGISDTGHQQMMYPGQDYIYDGNSVTEYPILETGGSIQDKGQLKKLDQLTNFTNYNDMAKAKQGKKLKKAQGGGIFDVAKAIGSSFTTPGKNGAPASGGLGDTIGNIFGGSGGAKGIMDASQNMFKDGFSSGLKQLGTSQGLATAGKAAGLSVLNAAPQILQGIGQIKQQKTAIDKANQASQISGLNAQVAALKPEKVKNQYNRPEDALVQPGQLGNPMGTGTNFLAQNGAEIQNTYAPGNLYNDLGYEPLNDSNPKQYQKGGRVISRDKINIDSYGNQGVAYRDIFENPNMTRDTAYSYESPTSLLKYETNSGKPFAYASGRGGFTSAQPDSLAKYKELLSAPFHPDVEKSYSGTKRLASGKYQYGGDLPTAEFGDYFQDSGQASIGKGVGSAVGSIFGPLGSQVGGFLGTVAGNLLGGADDANKLARYNTQNKKNIEQTAWSQGAQSLHSQNASYMKDGGSIVDYMNNKGMNSSFESRKKLYKNIFGESFSGKADQNLKLLNALSSDVKDSSFQKPSTASSKKETPTKKQTVKDSIAAQNVTTPFTNPNYPMTAVDKHLESGIIIDKNTNEAYVIKGNKLVKQFPVLTGQSRDGENKNNRSLDYLESHPESRVTPTGTYNMRPKKDIYGEPGYNLDPIPAFGYPAAEAKSIALHVTYPGDFAKRNPMYSLPGEQRTASYGCPNCRKPDINSLTNQYFPQGDTTMVIDSRNQMDRNVLNKLQKQENGGWVSNDWQPQVIATFGEHKLKDLLQPPHDADMLRAGGHLKSYTPPSARAMFTGKQMAMGGDLQVLDGGYAEPISYNPYMPGTGETVMFRGRSHDDGGIPIQYGQNGVEVEGGEPMFQMEDGGPVNNTSGVVAGNIKIDKFAAQHIEDPKAEGKKYKNYVADLSKVENKQNKLINKSTQLALDSDANSPFDQLSLNSAQANIMGANMKLKETAIKKMNAAAVQNAILDTAKELGVKSDKLAQGKFEKETDSRMAKFGAKMETAAGGFGIPKTKKATNSKKDKTYDVLAKPNYGTDYNLPSGFTPGVSALPSGMGGLKNGFAQAIEQSYPFKQAQQSIDIPFKPGYVAPAAPVYSSPSWYKPTSSNITGVDIFGNYTGPQDSVGAESDNQQAGFDWKGLSESALSNVAPLLRPSNQEPLDPSQLYPEMFALGSNQLEPVRAQQFQPMLQNQPSRISLQDQINTVDSQANAAIRAAGQNPAAQAQIMAQAIEAKNRIKGEEFRMNQQAADQTYAQNRQVLNDAQLRNLQLLDQQYVRQAEAKSKTKAQAIEALKSIATKTAQNKLENRQLGIYENLYNYRFGPKGQAYNVNPLAQFNIPEGVGADNLSEADKSKVKDLYEKIVNRDKAGNVIGSREKLAPLKLVEMVQLLKL